MAYARRWRITSREKLRSICAALAEMGVDFRRHPMELVFREPLREKSNAQRALFHAVASDFALWVGEIPRVMIEALKDDYYGPEWRRIEHLSTEQMTEEEYGALIEHAYFRAAWCGCFLPDRRTQ